MASVDDLIRFCRLNLSEDDAERLVGWLAWRTQRNQALAGDRASLDRLRHAIEHWLDSDERRMLLDWLSRRVEGGRSVVPR